MLHKANFIGFGRCTSYQHSIWVTNEWGQRVMDMKQEWERKWQLCFRNPLRLSCVWREFWFQMKVRRLSAMSLLSLVSSFFFFLQSAVLVSSHQEAYKQQGLIPWKDGIQRSKCQCCLERVHGLVHNWHFLCPPMVEGKCSFP